MKRIGIFKISYEQMARYLELPEGHQVVDIVEIRNRQANEVAVKVMGPRMHEVQEGAEIPWVPIDHLKEGQK